MGFPYFDMELSTIFPYSKVVIFIFFPVNEFVISAFSAIYAISAFSEISADLEMDFLHLKWFKKVLFKNDKSKKVLEIDVEKDGGIFFN